MSPERKAKLKKFAKRSAKRLLLFGAVLGVLYGIENWRGNRYFDDHVASLKSRGESLKLEEIFPPAKRLRDEDNVAFAPVFDRFYIKDPASGARRWALDDLKLVPIDLPQQQREAIADWNKAIIAISSISGKSCYPAELAIEIKSAGKGEGMRKKRKLHKDEGSGAGLLTDGESPESVIAKFQESHSGFLNELKVAAQRSGCGWPELGLSEYLPQGITIGQNCMRAMSRACLLALAQNQSDEAFLFCRALIRFAKSERTPGSYFSCTYRISGLGMISKLLMAGISAPSWTAHQLAEIQSLLPEADIADGLVEELREGRARLANQWHSSSWIDYEIQIMPCGGSGPEFMNLLFYIGPRGWHQRNRVLHSEMTQRRIDFIRAGKPLSELKSIGFPDQGFFYKLFALDDGSERSTCIQSAQSLDTFSLCSAAIALQRFKIHAGEFPKSLDQLVPTFLPALPKSYFNGRTPSYRIEPSGQFRLWYFGLDGDDDGGRGEYDEGKRRYSPPDFDLVFSSPP